jgi:hypothetical protein
MLRHQGERFDIENEPVGYQSFPLRSAGRA